MERLWSSIADRGRPYAEVLQPDVRGTALDKAQEYARALLSERGEASGAAIARELLGIILQLGESEKLEFYGFLADEFLPSQDALRAAAESYLADPSPLRAAKLASAAEPVRQELLRRMNMAPGGTAALVAMRKNLLTHLKDNPALQPLDSDLRHLFASWFNRGFLELRRISWQTSAVVLEKLITYEAVHAIEGWEDLRRRLAPDRRCFGFFHPALPDEPLIFVEVALTTGLASSVQPLLERGADLGAQRETERVADAAIFYSISNCQDGLRSVSFGNFLIKQVVEELKAELPGLVRFSTLSPVPGFCRWLETRVGEATADAVLHNDEVEALRAAAGMGELTHVTDGELLTSTLGIEAWWQNPALADALRAPLVRLCATYLVSLTPNKGPIDPVARFHLANGARLERVNWLGNTAPRGIRESFGLMVNYLYDPEQIEANHEKLIHGTVVRSSAVDGILGTPAIVQGAVNSAVGRTRRGSAGSKRERKSK